MDLSTFDHEPAVSAAALLVAAQRWGFLVLRQAASSRENKSRPCFPDDASWAPAPAVEDDIIVINVRDGLALWSGERLKSTKHRLSWESLPADQSRKNLEPDVVHPVD